MKTLIKVAGTLSLLLWGTLAFAQSDTAIAVSSNTDAMSKVVFPVAELGNCDSRAACKLYCDATSHREACFAFAQKVGLMTKEKIEAAKKIISKNGPGGCDSRDTCVAYCADSSHADECLSFAQSHKIITDERVSLIKKFVKGEGPGACKSTESCRAYCSDPTNGQECRAFAQENGLEKPRMGSTTPPTMKPPRMGSSTEPMPRPALLKNGDKMGSSTPPGLMKGEPPRKVSSTTSNGEQKKLIPPMKPLNKIEGSNPEKDNLGASVIKAFVHLLGF